MCFIFLIPRTDQDLHNKIYFTFFRLQTNFVQIFEVCNSFEIIGNIEKDSKDHGPNLGVGPVAQRPAEPTDPARSPAGPRARCAEAAAGPRAGAVGLAGHCNAGLTPGSGPVADLNPVQYFKSFQMSCRFQEFVQNSFQVIKM